MIQYAPEQVLTKQEREIQKSVDDSCSEIADWFFSMLKHPNVVLVYVVVPLGPSKSGIVMDHADDILCSYCERERGVSLMNDRVTEKKLCSDTDLLQFLSTLCPLRICQPKSWISDRLYLKNIGVNTYSTMTSTEWYSIRVEIYIHVKLPVHMTFEVLNSSFSLNTYFTI